jgi:hypothetical protein
VRPAVAAALSLGGFGATLALLLLLPSDGFVVGAALVLGLLASVVLAALRRLQLDAVPWLAVPPLAALTLWAFSAPALYPFAAIAAVVGWCLVGAVLFVRLFILVRRPLGRREAWVWGSTVVIALLLLAAARAETPLELRFALSKAAMNAAARAVINGDRDPATIDRIGLWRVTDVRRVRGGMRFAVKDAGFLDTVGFAHQADGLPPPGNYSYEYYRDGWYIWTTQFGF